MPKIRAKCAMIGEHLIFAKSIFSFSASTSRARESRIIKRALKLALQMQNWGAPKLVCSEDFSPHEFLMTEVLTTNL